MRASSRRAASASARACSTSAARRLVPSADLREASWDALPWPDASFDVVTAVNALQFADDTVEALMEAIRLTRPGGLVAVANWAERAVNDLDSIDAALAIADGDDPMPDGDLQLLGGLEKILLEVGLKPIGSGTVAVPWRAADATALLRGVLLDDPVPATVSETRDRRDTGSHEELTTRDLVIAAARPFRREDGSYVLHNTFRFAVGRVAGGPEYRPDHGRGDA